MSRRCFAGFTLLETLLALALLAFITALSVPLLGAMSRLKEQVQYNYQDDIGVYQLQIRLATANIDQIDLDEIQFHNPDYDYQLHIVNENLIVQPGTLIFLHDIDSVDFSLEDDIVVMEYCRQEGCWRQPIAYYAPLDSDQDGQHEIKLP